MDCVDLDEGVHKVANLLLSGSARGIENHDTPRLKRHGVALNELLVAQIPTTHLRGNGTLLGTKTEFDLRRGQDTSLGL